MDRRLCLHALTTVTAVAWLPGPVLAEMPHPPPQVPLPPPGKVMPVPSGQTAAPDPLYAQAVAIVMNNNEASISLVQRHLRLGYTRAAGLLASMEQAGLISAYCVNGRRQILSQPSA